MHFTHLYKNNNDGVFVTVYIRQLSGFILSFLANGFSENYHTPAPHSSQSHFTLSTP